MLLEIISSVFVLIFAIFYYVNRRPPYYAPVPRISIPILGHLPYFAKYEKIGIPRLFMEWTRQSKSPIIGVDFGNFRSVVLNDYKLIKASFNLVSMCGRPQTRAFSVRGGDDGVNRGLIWSDGATSMEQRRFAIRELGKLGFGKKSMESIILTEAEALVDSLTRDAGNPIDASKHFYAAIVNAFWVICAGERFSYDDPKFIKLCRAVVQYSEDEKYLGVVFFMPWFCTLFPKLSGWNAYLEHFHSLNNYMKSFIADRITTHETGSRSNFIDAYIEELNSCKDTSSSFYAEEGMKNILNTMGDMFTAGSETASTTLSWLALYLATNPMFQAEVHREVDDIIGNKRWPTLYDRISMPYTEAFIEETIRLSSIVALGGIHRAIEDVTLEGVYIPEGTLIISNIYGVNHDVAVWGNDADDFKPERHLSSDKKQVTKNEAMIAFSTGRRACIGEAITRDELFLFATSMLQKFVIHYDPTAPAPTIQPNFGGIVTTPFPHKLVFRKRF